jgi:hypothetical protein
MECPRVSTPTSKEKPDKSIKIFDYHKTNASSELLEEPYFLAFAVFLP